MVLEVNGQSRRRHFDVAWDTGRGKLLAEAKSVGAGHERRAALFTSFGDRNELTHPCSEPPRIPALDIDDPRAAKSAYESLAGGEAGDPT